MLNTAAFLASLVPASLGASAALAQTPPGPGNVCGAVFDETNNFVTVTCSPGQQDSERTFFFRNADFFLNEDYDGSGPDRLIMDGGALINEGWIPDAATQAFIDSLDLDFDPSDGTFNFLAGNDVVEMRSGSVGTAGAPATLSLGEGNDTFNMTGGTVFADINGDADDDTFIFNGGTITGDIDGGEGNDTFAVGGGTVNGDIEGGGGNNSFAMTSGTVNGNVAVDGVRIDGGTINGDVYGDGSSGAGDTTENALLMNGGIINGDVIKDTTEINGGTVNGDVSSGSVVIHGGAISGDVSDGDGPASNFWMTSGTVGGDIVANVFDIDGGTVGGDVYGLNTLLMHENFDYNGVAAPIRFRDGVVFSGSNANGSLQGVRFTTGSQNFTGFNTLALNDSVIRFGGDQRIDNVVAANGSNIMTTGNSRLLSQDGTGLGTLSLDGSGIDMVNGIASDTFTVGGLAMNNGSILIDYDQDGGAIDSLIVAPGGTSAITGTNLIRVNILGTPVLDRSSDIAVLQAGSAIDPSLFQVEGIGGTLSSLYNYEVVSDPAGGLTLRASPVDQIADPLSPVNTTILTTSLNQLNDITDSGVSDALGLSTSSGGGAGGAGDGTPFGVFSTGQLARSHYDGFRVVGTGQSTPSYSSTEMSMAASLDWNASEYFGFDQQYGLNIGVFGGYASSDVDLGSFLSFASAGSAVNRSGLFGGYTLFRKERSYIVFSAIGLLGNTDVTNGLLNNSTGSYNTQGAAVTLSAGHIFSLTDTVRFDLRGGVLAARFTGDAFTDSIGVNYGKSEVSFAGLKFEPGIYMDHKLDNGMSISPYLRAEFQQLLGYKNKSGIGGVNYEFDTATFSAALSGGANLQVNPTTTLSSEVKVKASADSHSIAGKLGLKFAF